MQMKRAAIYVRTSSEQQGEKSSPEEQERDCRQLAEEQGLEVVGVFQDVTKYRVKKKLVEPSGTRVDRPGLLAMMAAAGRGEFDAIIAWKEDRLYRGLKAMLFVLEGVQEQRLEVLLARENFDARMAPVKAWVAGMELDNLKERMAMGVKARLRAGKANTGQDRYGYRREGGEIVIVEEEARWVRRIFEWYGERVAIREIRRRLIEAGAPQKGGTVPRKMQWGVHTIQSILLAGEEYALGIKRQSRGGEWFTLPVEPIISPAMWERAKTTREGNRSWPSHNVKWDYLARGLIYCPCGRCWGARMTSYRAKGVKRKTPTGTYFCRQRHEEMRHADCPKTIGSRKADEFLWGKVEAVLHEPGLLLAGARQHVARLQEGAGEIVTERQRLERELGQSADERGWVITQARKGRITEEEMDEQLAAVGQQEVYLRREIARLGAAVDLAGLTRWEEIVTGYLADLREGLAALDTLPETEEEERARFDVRRQIVEGLVERVTIGRDRELTVVFRIDVLSLLPSSDRTKGSGGWVNELVLADAGGIYSRRRSSLPARLCGACA